MKSISQSVRPSISMFLNCSFETFNTKSFALSSVAIHVLILLERDGYIGDVCNCLKAKRDDKEGRSCWEQFTATKNRQQDFEALIDLDIENALNPATMIYNHVKSFEEFIKMEQKDKKPPVNGKGEWMIPGTNYGDESSALWDKYYAILLERKERLLDEVLRVLNDHFKIEPLNNTNTYQDKLGWLKDNYESLIPNHSKIINVSNFRKNDIVDY